MCHFPDDIQYQEGGLLMNYYPNYNRKEFVIPFEPDMMMQAAKQEDMTGLVSPEEGLKRGNLFAGLYEPWSQNEPYPLKPKNEREALLNKVREFDFACYDLALYLDVYPNDTEKIQLRDRLSQQGKQWRSEYERKYGPLSLGGEGLNRNPWAWVMEPWPWED